jgi:hypothetical protein
MPPYTRRDFIAIASAGAALAAFATDTFAAEATPEAPVKASTPPAFTTLHEQKPLPFNPAKLDYQMDYGATTASYIDAFFRNIQWDIVAFRLDKARQMRALAAY